MFKKVILVTGIGGDIGQSVIKCLKEIKCSIDIIGCDIERYAAARKVVDRFFEAPRTTEEQEYFDFIQKLIKDEGINYILPTSEVEIEFYNRHRDCFDNAVIFINKSEIVKTFLDKYETANFLKNNNFPYPTTYLITDYNKEMSFPVLLKKRKGWGAKGLIIINDGDELEFHKKRTDDAIIQEIIGTPDEEYTVSVFSTGKDTYSIAFKRCLGYGSLTKVAQLICDDEINDLAEKIAKAIALEGSINIQLRKTNKHYIPFEINPRFSSTVYIRHCFGFEDVKWWINLKEGRDIEYVPRYKGGVAVRTIGELFFDLVSA